MDERTYWQQLLQTMHAGIRITSADELRDWSESRVVRLAALSPNGSPLSLYAKHDRSAGGREAAVYRAAVGLNGFPAPAARFLRGPDGIDWLVIPEACGEPLHKLPPKDWITACGALAAFHERAVSEGWVGSISGLPALHDSLVDLPWPILEATARCASDGQYAGVDITGLDVAARRLRGAWPQVSATIDGYPVTLIHGDAHSGNLFLSPDGSVELIDWAAAQAGPGLCDIIGLFDTAARMREDCPQADAMAACWNGLSAQSQRKYGDATRACASLSVLRALTELQWFAASGDDYGERANREFAKIETGLDNLGI